MPRRLVVAVPESLFDADPESGAGRVWRSVLAELAARVELVPAGDPGRHPWRRRRRPDVCLASGHHGPVAREEPVVAVVHGAAWALEEDLSPYIEDAYLAPFVRATDAALHDADAVITPSQYTRRAVLAGYPFAEEDVHAVAHGVDRAIFHPGRTAPRERPYVLFAAVPSRHKNLQAVKEAIAALARRGLPHELVVAGAAPQWEPQEVVDAIPVAPSGAEGRVTWLGHVAEEQLAALMAGADAFCLPSFIDAFGLTALEAMACGCPVVVSDRGALPDVVGDAATVCPPTAEAVTEALHALLSDPARAREHRERGLRRAAELTWARTADGWLAALRAACR